MATKRAKKAQKRVLEEIKGQLLTQAERWGRKDAYTPIILEEMELAQCLRIKGDFLSEKANLEYELNSLGTDKREVLIKIERLNAYLKRADQIIARHEKTISRIIDKDSVSKERADRILKKGEKEHKISVMVSN